MSFKATYAVITAWQKASRLTAETCTWRLLLWLARNADDKSLSVIRSQARLAEEIGVTERTVNAGIRHWRDKGVIVVLEHGGGRSRKPARYGFDLSNLDVYAMRCQDRETAEAIRLRELEGKSTIQKSKTSGVTGPTHEVHKSLEMAQGGCTSGVEAELQKSEGGIRDQLQKLMTSDSSESYSEKNFSEERLPPDSNQPLVRPLARSPNGRLAGARAASAVDLTRFIRAELEIGTAEERIVKMFRSHGITLQDVQAVRAKQ